jgi:hypothetical protein
MQVIFCGRNRAILLQNESDVIACCDATFEEKLLANGLGLSVQFTDGARCVYPDIGTLCFTIWIADIPMILVKHVERPVPASVISVDFFPCIFDPESILVAILGKNVRKCALFWQKVFVTFRYHIVGLVKEFFESFHDYQPIVACIKNSASCLNRANMQHSASSCNGIRNRGRGYEN